MVWWNEEGQESRKTTICTKDRLLICDRWAVLHTVLHHTVRHHIVSYRTAWEEQTSLTTINSEKGHIYYHLTVSPAKPRTYRHIYWVILLLCCFYYFFVPYEVRYDTTHSMDTQVLLEMWPHSVYKQGWLSSAHSCPGGFLWSLTTPQHCYTTKKVTYLLSLFFCLLTLIFCPPKWFKFFPKWHFFFKT